MAEQKLIEERGQVVSKYIKKATDAFTNKQGKEVKAQPEKHIVLVVSGSRLDDERGYVAASLGEYSVTPEVYDKAKFGDKADVIFELKASQNGGGTYNSPVDFKLVEHKADKKTA